MVPKIAFGHNTQVILDVGCGVASFGAYLLSRDVITLFVAPKDVHENQIQFALERGVPAMVAAFATRRLLYPSQAFELIHCSRCRINWTRDVKSRVQMDGKVVTSRGPGTTMEFFVALGEQLYGKEKADEVSGPLNKRGWFNCLSRVKLSSLFLGLSLQ